MKHVVAALLAAMLVLSGCAAPASTPNSTPVSSEAPAPGEGVEVDKNLLTVDITLPASVFENDWVKGIDEIKNQEGVIKVATNSDGSVTVTITKAEHIKLLSDIEDSLGKTFTELISSAPYIKSIEHFKGFKEVTIRVERAGYEKEFMKVTPFVIALNISIYQMFAGEELKVEITIVDDLNGEKIEAIKYPEDFNKK